MCFAIPSGWEETIVCEHLLGNYMQVGIYLLFGMYASNSTSFFSDIFHPDPLNYNNR